MSYREWPIEDEYEIHRIRTLVIRDINSKASTEGPGMSWRSFNNFSFVDEGKQFMVENIRSEVRNSKGLIVWVILQFLLLHFPNSSHFIKHISMGISWMLQIRQRDTNHNLLFQFWLMMRTLQISISREFDCCKWVAIY
jgi:hypothetical protein